MRKTICYILLTVIAPMLQAAQTCNELNTEDSFVNQFSLENPFQACGQELNLRGLPNLFDVAFGRLNSYGRLGNDLRNTVCSSVFQVVNGAYNDLYDQIINSMPPGYNGPNWNGLDEYCRNNPNICSERTDDRPPSERPPNPTNDDRLCQEKPWRCIPDYPSPNPQPQPQPQQNRIEETTPINQFYSAGEQSTTQFYSSDEEKPSEKKERSKKKKY